jgi:hypothetical protein
MRLETAKTQILIGSGSVVGLAAVVGIMPPKTQPLSSPLLYLVFALVFYSILAGIMWMLEIAKVTASSEGEALGTAGREAAISLGIGLMTFVLYVFLNTPRLSRKFILSAVTKGRCSPYPPRWRVTTRLSTLRCPEPSSPSGETRRTYLPERQRR